jgi:formamidopyrimidine-DNA glycosylase
MPELAEVEFYRQRWNPGIGETIQGVLLHPQSRVFRGGDPTLLVGKLTGDVLLASETAGKQMLFRSRGDGWLGIHLGLTGELSLQPADYAPGKSDHLVLVQRERALVFTDPRMFGRVQFHAGPGAPAWWTGIAPPILSAAFTVEALAAFLHRRARTPIKSVLLLQERFPGIGNWMADEILWRAALHPRRPAGSLTAAELKTLHREIRWVAENALRIIGAAQTPSLPDPPATWLFIHRREAYGKCPKTGAPLIHEEIGGRITCWSPARQKL